MKQETIKTIVENRKLVVNGVDILLTDEQLKQFEGLVEKPRHKMSKPKNGEYFYVIRYTSIQGYHVKESIWEDNKKIFQFGNCYLDKELAEQVAMEMNLQEQWEE